MKPLSATLATAKFVSCVDMFRNLGVPDTNTLKRGAVFTVVDPTIRRTVLVAQGMPPAANKYAVPSTVNVKSYCQAHRYVFVQLASSVGGEGETGIYQISFLCHSSSGTSVRVIFTNISCAEPKVTSTSIVIPLELSRWTTLAVDMEQVFRHAYRNAIAYKGVLQFEAMSSTVIKGVYFCTKPFTPYDVPEVMLLPLPLELASGNYKSRFQSDIPPLLQLYDWIAVGFDTTKANDSQASGNIYKSNLSGLWPKVCTHADFFDPSRNVTRHPTGVSGEIVARVEVDSATLLPNRAPFSSHRGHGSTSAKSSSGPLQCNETIDAHIKRTRGVQSANRSSISTKTTFVTTRVPTSATRRRSAPVSTSTPSQTAKASNKQERREPDTVTTSQRLKSRVQTTNPLVIDPNISVQSEDAGILQEDISDLNNYTPESGAILSISDSRLRSDRCYSVETPLTAAICAPAVTIVQPIPVKSEVNMPILTASDAAQTLTINQLLVDTGEKVDQGLQDGFEKFNEGMTQVKVLIDQIYSRQKQMLRHINTANISSFLSINKVPLRYLTHMSALEPQIAIGFQTTTRFIYSFPHKSLLPDPLSCRNVERGLLEDASDDQCEEAACRILNATFNMRLFDLVERVSYQSLNCNDAEDPALNKPSKTSRPSSTKFSAQSASNETANIPILEQANQLVTEICRQTMATHDPLSAKPLPQNQVIQDINKASAVGQTRRRFYEEGIGQTGRQYARKKVRIAEPLTLTLHPSSGIQPVYTGYPLVLCFLSTNYVAALLSFYEYVVSHDNSYTVSPLRAQFSLSHDYCILCLTSMLLQDKHKDHTLALLQNDDESSLSTCVECARPDHTSLSAEHFPRALYKSAHHPPGLYKQKDLTEPFTYARYKQYNGDVSNQSPLGQVEIQDIIDKLSSRRTTEETSEKYRYESTKVLLIASAKYSPFIAVFFGTYLALFEVMPLSLCARLKALLFYDVNSAFPYTIQAASFSDDSSKLVIAGCNSSLTSVVTAVIDLTDAIDSSNEFILLSGMAIGDQLQASPTLEPVTQVMFHPGSNDQFVTLSATQFRGWRIKYIHGVGYIKTIAVEICNKEVQSNLTHNIKKYVLRYVSENIMQPEKANKRFLSVLSRLIKRFSKLLFTDMCFSGPNRIQIATACGVILIFNFTEILRDSSKIMLLLPSNTPDYRPLAACALSVNRVPEPLLDSSVDNYIIFSSTDGIVRSWTNNFETLIMQSRFKAPVVYLREVTLSGTSRAEATSFPARQPDCIIKQHEGPLGLVEDSKLGGFSGISKSSFYEDDAAKHTVVYSTIPPNLSSHPTNQPRITDLSGLVSQTHNASPQGTQDIDAHLANNMYYIRKGPFMLRQGSSLIPDQQSDHSTMDQTTALTAQELIGQLSYINMLGQRSRMRQSITHAESTGSQYPSVSIDTIFFDSASDTSDTGSRQHEMINSGFRPINGTAQKDPVLSTLRMHHNYGSNYANSKALTAREAADSLNKQFKNLLTTRLKGNTQRLVFNNIGLSLPSVTAPSMKLLHTLQAPASSGTFMSVCLNGDVGLLSVGDSKGPVYNTVLCTQYKNVMDARVDPKHNEGVVLTNNVINIFNLATGLRSVYFKVTDSEPDTSMLVNAYSLPFGKCCYHPTSYVIAVMTNALNCLLLDISNQAVMYNCNLRASLREASKVAAERSANAEMEMIAVNTTYMQSMHIDVSVYEQEIGTQGEYEGEEVDSWIGETGEATTFDNGTTSASRCGRTDSAISGPHAAINTRPKSTQSATARQATAQQAYSDLLSRQPQSAKAITGSKRQVEAALYCIAENYTRMLVTGELEKPLEINHNLTFTPSGSHLLMYIDNYLFSICTNGYAELRLIYTNNFPIRQIVVGISGGSSRRPKEVLAMINLRNEISIFSIESLLLNSRPKVLKVTRYPQLAHAYAYQKLELSSDRYRLDDLVPLIRTPILIAVNVITESLIVLVVDSIEIQQPSNITADEKAVRDARQAGHGTIKERSREYAAVYSIQAYSFSTGEMEYELPVHVESGNIGEYIPIFIASSQLSGAIAIFFRGPARTKMISIPLSIIAEVEMEFSKILNKLTLGEQVQIDTYTDMSRIRCSMLEYPIYTVDHDSRLDRFFVTGRGMQSAAVYTWNTGEYVEFSSLSQCIEHEEGYDEMVKSYLIDQQVKRGVSLNERKPGITQSAAYTDKETVILAIDT